MADTIFLELDFPSTKKRLREHWKTYNETAREHNKTAEKKKPIVKNSVFHTLVTILEFYSAHLYQNFKLNRPNELRPFRTNNVAIAGKVGAVGITDRSVKRHIVLLMQMGVITKKIWHGTNSSFELYFNPALLIAKTNFEYLKGIRKIYEMELNRQELTDTEMKVLLQQRPRFEDYPNGILDWKKCPYIPSLLPLNKFNNESGIVNFGNNRSNHPQTQQPEIANDLNSMFYKNQGSNENSAKPEISAKVFNNPVEKQEQIARPEKLKQEKAMRDRDFYVFLAWQFAKTVLYPKETFHSPQRITIAKTHLRTFFSNADGSPLENFQNRYNQLVQRILIMKNCVRKEPHRFVPPPDKFFDPSFKTAKGTPAGFASTKYWYDFIKQKRLKNELYYDNMRLFSECCKEYSQNMNVETYRRTSQQLGKKKDSTLLDDFNRFVLSSQHENDGTYFAKRWERHLIAEINSN